MKWKLLIALSVAAIITGGVVWVLHGMEMYTKDREKVVTIVKDELFGTSNEVVEWKQTFRYGLLPDDASITVLHRGYAFVVGLAGAAIFLSIYMLRRKNA